MFRNLINGLLGRRNPVGTEHPQGVVERASQRTMADPVEEFLQLISGLGHPQYPILDATYSPNSRVPCTDLTTFIIKRLEEGDNHSIIRLFGLVLQSNPGLGLGPEWIDSIVNELVRTPFDRYVRFVGEKGVLEFRALFMVAAKDGGGREFAIASPVLRLFAQALACQLPTWRPEMQELAKRANSFIRKMRRDTPFWREFPLFKWAEPPTLTDSDFARSLREVSVAARLQVLLIASIGPTPLSRASDYQMRNIGLHPLVTARELSKTELLVEVSGQERLWGLWGKGELLEVFEKRGVPHKKSWKKEKLIEVLVAECPDLVKERLSRDPVFVINPQYASAATQLIQYAEDTTSLVALLCFA